MGHASTLEDIRDAIADRLFQPARETLDELERLGQPPLNDGIHRLRVLLSEAQKLIADLNEKMDIATDPAVDMAFSLTGPCGKPSACGISSRFETRRLRGCDFNTTRRIVNLRTCGCA